MPSPASAPDGRPRCLACRQAADACWCGHVREHRAGTRVILLQHPREAKNPLGTARMAHLALPGSRLLVGLDFEEDPRFRRWVAEAGEGSVVLSAAPDARPVAELAGRPGPLTLWVIDGTWWQARKIWQRNPTLRRLPAYRIDPSQPSRYLIRAEPAPHCLSTVEAVAAALDAVEGVPGGPGALLEPLGALVERQLAHARSEARRPRRRLRARAQPCPATPGPRLPAALAGDPARALLVCAEGNAWPGDRAARRPVELLQWLAARPATGERFAALLRPEAGLSPTVTEHLGLEPAAFAGALPRAELLARWEAFVHPEDVWCTWGYRPIAMLAAAGGPTPPADAVLDVRDLAHVRLDARPGQLEDAHRLIGAPAIAPVAPGRGGRRLALLEAVAGRLLGGG